MYLLLYVFFNHLICNGLDTITYLSIYHGTNTTYLWFYVSFWLNIGTASDWPFFPNSKLENYVFAVLSDLVKLDLSHCGLISIQPRAFSGLDSLEWLHLNDNRLSALHPTALLPLKAIHGLHLHSNPWNCSCGLRPTIEWMKDKNVVPNNIPPTCHKPNR